MPDKPYSLYQGLAGTICAWAEACVVIAGWLEREDKGREMGGSGVDEGESRKASGEFELGFPTLGGGRITGLL